MAPNIQLQPCLEISYNLNMMSMKSRESMYKIQCYACHYRYKDNQQNVECCKCGSKFIETKLLQRELAPTNPAINHQRRALWINAFGRIQAAPIKSETKTVSNDLLLVQRTEKATEEKECSICMDMIRIEDKVTSLDNCIHQFHEQCIKIWVKTSKNTCPICNQQAFGT